MQQVVLEKPMDLATIAKPNLIQSKVVDVTKVISPVTACIPNVCEHALVNNTLYLA